MLLQYNTFKITAKETIAAGRLFGFSVWMNEHSGSECGNDPLAEPQRLTHNTIKLTSNMDSDSLCSELSET